MEMAQVGGDGPDREGKLNKTQVVCGAMADQPGGSPGFLRHPAPQTPSLTSPPNRVSFLYFSQVPVLHFVV